MRMTTDELEEQPEDSNEEENVSVLLNYIGGKTVVISCNMSLAKRVIKSFENLELGKRDFCKGSGALSESSGNQTNTITVGDISIKVDDSLKVVRIIREKD